MWGRVGLVFRAFFAGIRVHIALVRVVVSFGTVGVGGPAGSHICAVFCSVAAHRVATA